MVSTLEQTQVQKGQDQVSGGVSGPLLFDFWRFLRCTWNYDVYQSKLWVYALLKYDEGPNVDLTSGTL